MVTSLHRRGLAGGSDGKEPACNAEEPASIPGLGRSLEEEMATHSSILAGDSHGQRSLGGYSPWGCKDSDKTEVTEHWHTNVSR